MYNPNPSQTMKDVNPNPGYRRCHKKPRTPGAGMVQTACSSGEVEFLRLATIRNRKCGILLLRRAMNDDPGSSSATRQQQQQSSITSPTTHTTAPHPLPISAPQQDRENDAQANTQEKQRAGLAKKLEFMTHLQQSLDLLVYVYISTLYYMECSFARLLLRTIPHYILLSPKEGLILPAQRVHIIVIFGPAIICILWHIFSALPEASEATRGYLHGGVLMDFIGQEPPSSRLTLIFIDIIILFLQCLMLAVHQDRERLKQAVHPSLRTLLPGSEADSGATEPTQDHDAEERGVLRDQTYMVDNEGVELQPLNGESSAADEEERERTTGPYASVTTSADMLDIMRSGNAVLSNFHIPHALRSVGGGVQNTAAYSLRSFGEILPGGEAYRQGTGTDKLSPTSHLPMPPRTFSLDLTRTSNYVCKSCLSSLRPVNTTSPALLAAKQYSSASKKPKKPTKAPKESEKGIEFPDPEDLQRMLAEDLENETPDNPTKSLGINYFTRAGPDDLRALPDNDAFSEESGGLDTEALSAIEDLEKRMVYTIKMFNHLEKQGKREKADQLRQQFRTVLRMQYKGKTGPESEVFGVLRIPGFSSSPYKLVANLNIFLARGDVVKNGIPRPRDIVDCWKYYSAARKTLSTSWESVPRGVWDFLWMVLSFEHAENTNRMHHIYVLSKDMQAAGIVLTESQQLLTLEAIFIEGWQAEAIEAWKKAVVTLGSKKETFKPYYELGVRMLSLHGDTERAQKTAQTLLKSSHKCNPRILVPVIRALAVKEATIEEAWETYRDMQTLLGDTMTIENYDEVVHAFLTVSSVEYALQVFVDMMFSRTVDIRGKTRLPMPVGNTFFMGKWLKRLIGAGDLDGAYKAVVYLQNKGVVPAPVQLNGLIGAWLRSGTVEHVEMADKLAWSMIQARLDYVRLRQQESLTQPPVDISGPDPYTPKETEDEGEQDPEFKSRTRATVETFSLLAENYCSRRLHDRLVKLFRVLQEAEIEATGFIMNQLIRSYSQNGMADKAIDLYLTMTMDQGIRPDGHTFLSLFNLLSVNRLVHHDARLYVEDRKLGRQFFSEMVTAKWDLDSAELLAQLPRTIIFSLLKVKDYTGTIVAARTMRLLMGFYPTEPFLVELASGINTLNIKTKRNFERMTGASRRIEVLMRKYRRELVANGHPGDEMTDEEKIEEAHVLLQQLVLIKAGAQEIKPHELEAELAEVAKDMGVYEITVLKDSDAIRRHRKFIPPNRQGEEKEDM
ncbi:hypothetical protein QBC43DRAFT_374039 [Cladorrhinum sp. PSN259]|nr:hypothetical protein QBC43DRAFT_374039 [Cladorrhinum sp. PSN259]